MAWTSRAALAVACMVAAPFALVAPAACSGSGSVAPASNGAAGEATAGSPAASGGSDAGHAGTPAAGTPGVAGTGSAGNGAGGVAGSLTEGGTATGGGGGGGGLGEAGVAGVGEVASGGGCGFIVEMQTLEVGAHVTACSPVTYGSNPPSSGQHYPTWSAFGVYDFPLPRGFWMHNLEHGAVVVTYHCPDGCADEVAAATTWLGQLTADQACPAGPPRVLLIPDPKLDVAWAASAWGITLRADCFDEEAFTDFYSKRAGHPLAPEAAICTSGVDLRAPGADVCGANP